ncbi:MAG: tripartite tricarboxylate transporter substrate binding protein [Betaproteobacteria bacterium]|nr:tripartite tricarboxylate transporter substrate binding protein [Betaproteobacteria bacterium]
MRNPASAVLLLTMVGALTLPARAQSADAAKDYPQRPVRIVSGFAAGGSTDFLMRVLAPKLTERLGHPFIIEHRPGAGGTIGAHLVAKATPDGYTLLSMSGAFTANAAAVKTPYDPMKDFEWITTIVTYPFVLTTRNDLPAKTVAELIALKKKQPGKLNYGSVGLGSVFHLAAELFNSMAGTDSLHVPYKGGGEALTDMFGGRIDYMFMTLTGASAHIRANRIRGIAICSRERSPQMPELPPVSQVLPGFDVTSFAGMGAPARTPKPVIDKLNRELHAIMATAEVTKAFTEAGGDMAPQSPQATTRHFSEEIAKWRRVVKERKIEVK